MSAEASTESIQQARQGLLPMSDTREAPIDVMRRLALSLRRAGTLFMAIGVLLLAPAVAQADYEQVKEGSEYQHFGVGGEAKQLQNATAIAINTTGAGGVEPGSFYVVGLNGRVVRYGPGSEGEAPPFREAWGWGVGNKASEYQRCGPALVTNEAEHTFHTCTPAPSAFGAFGGEQSGHFEGLAGVAVDPTTGNVYVLNENGEPPQRREHHLVEVFGATGIAVGEGFGDAGTKSPVESIAEGPGKIHKVFPTDGAITVDEHGVVYLTDQDYEGVAPSQKRVMSLKPQSPGDYEHYVYAGPESEVFSSAPFTRLGLVGANRLVAATENTIREYALGSESMYALGAGSTPICSFAVSGQINAMATNEVNGEVFYSTFAGPTIGSKLHRLGACDEATGEFKEAQAALTPEPKTGKMWALAVNPGRAWGSLRPAGTVYGVDAEMHTSPTVEKGIGDVFALSQAFSPEVLSEGVTNTTTVSTTLEAAINARHFTTTYAFQYLTEAAFRANEPNERQEVTVEATGGLLGLGFEGRRFGGAFGANLNSGSNTLEDVVTANGLADVHAADGTASLSGAAGEGTVIAGSKVLTAVTASEGTFAVGQTISGAGIPSGATIVVVSGSELTISAAATESRANTAIRSGTTTLTSLSTSEGAFEVGEVISGAGIPQGATIKAVSASELTLSVPTEKSGVAVAVSAGSTTLTSEVASEGTFEPGTPISGAGIPSGTTIIAVHPGSLVISNAPTQSGSAVAISSDGPAPLMVGESVEVPGIPAGAKIVAIEAGKLTLSAAAESTLSGVRLRAGMPFDATAGEVQSALDGLSTIGKGNVVVSGGPGDQTGSSPYEVEFTGSFTNQNVSPLEADASGLSGGPATATVATLHDGGGGFAHGALEVPVGGGQLAGNEVGSAAVGVSGLSPDTAYRYRVVASSECAGPHEPRCETVGGTAALATYPAYAAGLPDGRAYELVSPIDKNGGEVFPADPRLGSCLENEPCKPPGSAIKDVFPMQSAPDGNAVAYMGFPFSSNEGAVFDSYISRRTATGWQTTTMTPTLQSTNGGSTLTYDEQLDEGVISQESPQLSPNAPVGYPNFYLQNTADPAALEPMLTSEPEHRGLGSLILEYAGHTPDFSTQLFAANDALTKASAFAPEPPDPGQTGRDLYEYHAGVLALVNVLPDNAAVAKGAAFASVSPDTHAISTDGQRIYWHVGSTLYVREDGDTTREIRHPGTFLTASKNGLQVLLSDGCLYSLKSETCTDLTEGQRGFQGIMGTGEEDGRFSHIYFVDTAELPRASTNRGQSPQSEKDNLYSWSEDGLHFIATLPSTDGSGGAANLDDWTSSWGERTAQASPDGRYLAFGSTGQLTGYKNLGLCEKAFGGNLIEAACTEVFLYDSGTGRLICASCNPTGESPRGNSTLRRIDAAPAWLPQPRYLTDAGRLVFDSSDRLAAADSNGDVEDVYEYEPAGGAGEPAGDTCERAAGCVLLISPGTGSADSNFLAMDETGANIFFTTRERLVPQDKDELIDVYDAREGGGFASQTETQRVECQGEACQATPTPPSFTGPGSTTFSGTGNLVQSLPAAGGTVTPKKTVTGSSALAKRLRACHRKRSRRMRVTCEKRARRTAHRASGAHSAKHAKKAGKR